MARSRAKFFLFGAIACLSVSVCLSEDQLKEETVFSVGHSSDKNPHSRFSFFSRVPDLVWTNTGKSYEDPVIHTFGEGDDNEKIDLLLSGQELKAEQGSSFWVEKPHSKQYTPSQSPSSTSPSLAPPSPVPNSPSPIAPTPFPSGESPSPLPPTPVVAPSISPPFPYSPSPTSLPPSTSPSSTPYPFPSSPPYLPTPTSPPSVSPPINPPSVLPPVFPPFPFVTPPTFPPSASPSPYVSPPIFPPSSPSSPFLPPPIFPPQPPSQSPSPSPSSSPSPTPSSVPSSFSPSPTPSVTPPQPLPLPTPTPSPSSPTPSSPLPTPIPSPVPTPGKISILTNLIVSNGASLVPDFDPFVFNYKVSFGSNVRRFVVVAYLPKDDEDYKNLSLFIESVPLQSGEKSPPLKLGKRGESVTFHIYVRAVNHLPTTYVLSITREAGDEGLGTVAIIFVVLACIVGALILTVLGSAAYFYARTGRMVQLRDFQIFRGRDGTLYTSLIASGVTNDDGRL